MQIKTASQTRNYLKAYKNRLRKRYNLKKDT